ncbi:MAG: flagellar biosynthetic protein FliR [Deltaproteobacteria bacterium]|nr:MAG: flagellar biosynthetic protein FliR [Deltaproteobacteria bacterium]
MVEALSLIQPDEIRIFLLVLVRVSVVLFLFPIFGSPLFPAQIKAGLSLMVTIALIPLVSGRTVLPGMFPVHAVSFVLLVVGELIIGMVIALTVRMFFAAVQMAGQIIGFQMGFSMINVVDPQSGGQISLMEQFVYWVVLIIFLGLNGHHILLMSLAESFRRVPIGGVHLSGSLVEAVIPMSADIFSLGIRIAAPAWAAIFFTDAAFGITAKFAPQMNVLIVAFPVKITIGLITFGLALQTVGTVTREFLSGYGSVLLQLLNWMGGG